MMAPVSASSSFGRNRSRSSSAAVSSGVASDPDGVDWGTDAIVVLSRVDRDYSNFMIIKAPQVKHD